MKTLGVGIIGVGWVAGEYIKAFQADARSEVRALVGRSTARAEAYRERLAPQCTVGGDAGEMLARDDIDIVVVSTPHDQHTPYVVAAAEAGKHVVIEKPVALTPEDVQRQQEAVRRAGVASIVSFVLHWNPLLITAADLCRQGVFGNVFLIEVDYLHRIWRDPKERWIGTRRQGGSSMLAAGCHAVDAMRWFAGREPVEVMAYQAKTENPMEYPGTSNAIFRFDDGLTGRVVSSFDLEMPYRFHIGIHGTEGCLRDNQIFAPRLFPGQRDFAAIPCILPDSADVTHHPFQCEVSHFLDCLEKGERPFPDLDDAAKTMALCFAADRAAEVRQPVILQG